VVSTNLDDLYRRLDEIDALSKLSHLDEIEWAATLPLPPHHTPRVVAAISESGCQVYLDVVPGASLKAPCAVYYGPPLPKRLRERRKLLSEQWLEVAEEIRKVNP
jgi:hypothetical protein